MTNTYDDVDSPLITYDYDRYCMMTVGLQPIPP